MRKRITEREAMIEESKFSSGLIYSSALIAVASIALILLFGFTVSFSVLFQPVTIIIPLFSSAAVFTVTLFVKFTDLITGISSEKFMKGALTGASIYTIIFFIISVPLGFPFGLF
ncbi:hypothetical protein A2755_03810 [Candidatus Wolfebacteria bacterium RIFCSPHIGHO2_01_FULL_48_22]|uniref:Uncharacterized protein n=2 Tax=Candidatus Wolfeibacteriota TaxID=1752735 RepID=A0A1F8DR20_9BACT|nr:MAG: hypothetical protein A2755_03810 [Candidatus Wolfebacteria bacterium RIFCSPHIGHO2_01_FULL_48_22]OGM93465.1 MAG: hypothetical protein A2935_01160 [Candidatus Wolfebacteria bacterium RIFCSPLOWO2_01_FULL_47_17b]